MSLYWKKMIFLSQQPLIASCLGVEHHAHFFPHTGTLSRLTSEQFLFLPPQSLWIHMCSILLGWFKTHSPKWISYMIPLKEPRTWDLVGNGPRVKPLLLFCWKCHSNEMTSNDILPTHKSVPHSRLIREASPCRRWESTQKLRNGKCAASESSGVPRSKRGCFYQTYALKVKGSKQKRSGVRVTEMDCIQFTSSEAAE